MRTIIDLPEEDLQFLAKLCDREKISRAEAVRRAVAEYRQRQQIQAKSSLESALDSTFGLWKNKSIDSVEYQQKLRAEWDRSDTDTADDLL